MDAEAKKRALRMISYGLYVVTARRGEELAGGTVNWLTQASFVPPLVAVALRAESHLRDVVEGAGAFAVNLLGSGQKALAQDFFRPSRAEGPFLNDHPFRPGPATGSPILEEVPAWFEARVKEILAAGDHHLFLGEVVEAGVADPTARPLEMSATGWHYGG